MYRVLATHGCRAAALRGLHTITTCGEGVLNLVVHWHPQKLLATVVQVQIEVTRNFALYALLVLTLMLLIGLAVAFVTKCVLFFHVGLVAASVLVLA